MSYADKNVEYYGNPRKDIFDIFEKIRTKNKILEIGCGFGALGHVILNRFRPELYDGIELNIEARSHLLNAGYHNVYIGDALQLLKSGKLREKYDVIIMADVLEHIADDTSVLDLISGMLSVSGHVILSVPNVNNWQVIRNLFVRKSFPRDASGIFDSTHLRWYTKKDIIRIAESSDFKLKLYSSNKDRFGIITDNVVVPIFELLHKEIFVTQHILLLERV
jgi:2-polyprenyl-3-methyl-5-hydroxy-6-metoxy-1,4-benzoquinol methylase